MNLSWPRQDIAKIKVTTDSSCHLSTKQQQSWYCYLTSGLQYQYISYRRRKTADICYVSGSESSDYGGNFHTGVIHQSLYLLVADCRRKRRNLSSGLTGAERNGSTGVDLCREERAPLRRGWRIPRRNVITPLSATC